jgi:hypothetical protein
MFLNAMTSLMILSVSVAGYFCPGRSGDDNYREVVQRVSEMVWDQSVIKMASGHGLDVVNVTWEDTGRYSGSCWGPNISDMTIQVHSYENGAEQPTLTCKDLAPVSLSDFVDNIRYYLHDPQSWDGDEHSLLAERDSSVLVSAQAVFLPIPSSGNATFNPVLYNYQSYEGDPAVLTILVTREGTSVTVIDNTRDAVPGSWSWGQRLFFNEDGDRASFTGQRISDFRIDYANSGGDPSDISDESNLNMVLLIQIPLKQRSPQSTYFDYVCCESSCAQLGAGEFSRGSSDVEAAVIGHGELEGPFTEIDYLEIERDPEFPIRVTVQFYKATSNGVASQQDINEIAQEIQKVYDQGTYVGSLVVPDPGSYRPTDWDRASVPRRLNRYWRMVSNNYLSWTGRRDLIN